MSPGTRPSVPRVSGRRTPWSIPDVAPFAPGNVPNRLSNVRFSLIKNTTCLMGVGVGKAFASPGGGASAETVGVGEMFGAEVDGVADPPVQATAISPRHTSASATRTVRRLTG